MTGFTQMMHVAEGHFDACRLGEKAALRDTAQFGHSHFSQNRREVGHPSPPKPKGGLDGPPSVLVVADLFADAELADHGFIALGIVSLEVVEQATPLADQHKQAAARAVVRSGAF